MREWNGFSRQGKSSLQGTRFGRISYHPATKTEALEHFQLHKGKKVVLIIGGSLGSGTINKSILHYLYHHDVQDNYQLLWQTGNYHYNQIKTNQEILDRENVRIVPFIDRMDLAYAAADIIVSRAGAIAISELCIIGKPAILIPSPNVAEDHQTKNAEALVRKSAALMLKDQETVEKLFGLVTSLAADAGLQDELGRNIKTMALPGAAARIAEETIKTHQKKRIEDRMDIHQYRSIYFLGIGGIGMSALARYFHRYGVKVSGYDRTPTNLTRQLIGEGIPVHFDENPELIPDPPIW